MVKRDNKGQFLPGQSGNTTGRKRHANSTKLLKCATQKDIAKAYAALTKKAFSGDVRALKLFFDLCCEQPTQMIEQTVSQNTNTPEDIRKLFLSEFKGVKK